MLQQSSSGTRAVRMAGGEAPKEAASAASTLTLGSDGVPFTFEEDSPCPVTWCTAVSRPGNAEVALDDVRDFVIAAVSG
jgi:hypothetical protein